MCATLHRLQISDSAESNHSAFFCTFFCIFFSAGTLSATLLNSPHAVSYPRCACTCTHWQADGHCREQRHCSSASKQQAPSEAFET